MKKINVRKNIAQFVVIKGGVPEVLGEKKFVIGNSRTIHFRKRSFPIIFDVPAYRKGNNDYFLFDFDSPNQLISREMLSEGGFVEDDGGLFEYVPTGQITFLQELESSEKFKRALKILNLIANEEVIERLLKATELKKNWIDIIMALIAGAGVGLFIGLALGLSGVISG